MTRFTARIGASRFTWALTSSSLLDVIVCGVEPAPAQVRCCKLPRHSARCAANLRALSFQRAQRLRCICATIATAYWVSPQPPYRTQRSAPAGDRFIRMARSRSSSATAAARTLNGFLPPMHGATRPSSGKYVPLPGQPGCRSDATLPPLQCLDWQAGCSTAASLVGDQDKPGATVRCDRALLLPQLRRTSGKVPRQPGLAKSSTFLGDSPAVLGVMRADRRGIRRARFRTRRSSPLDPRADCRA